MKIGRFSLHSKEDAAEGRRQCIQHGQGSTTKYSLNAGWNLEQVVLLCYLSLDLFLHGIDSTLEVTDVKPSGARG